MSTKERTTQHGSRMILQENDLTRFAPLLEKFPRGVVFIDLETTGLSPLIDKIIEFAAIKLTPSGGLTSLSSLINPERPIPAETTAIHGITDHDVKDAPVIKDFIPTVLEFFEDLPVVAHNAKFDTGFIIFCLHQLDLDYPDHDIYCSLKMSRASFREMTSHKLSHLCQELDIKLENHHRALDDTQACLEVFAKAVARLSSVECKEALKESHLFNLNDFSKNTQMQLKKNLHSLYERTQKQQLVYIKYRGGTFKNELRPVKPMSLLPMPEGNILYAHCFLTNIYKSFALKKITLVQDMNAEQIQEAHKQLEKVKKED